MIAAAADTEERKIRADKSKERKIRAVENHESPCLNICNCRHFIL